METGTTGLLVTVLPELHCCRILGCSVDEVNDTKVWIESLLKHNLLEGESSSVD